MADSGTYDQATITRRQRIAEQMLAESSKPQKIQHWAQGLAQLGNVGADAFALNRLDKQAEKSRAADTAALMGILGGDGTAPQPASAAPASLPSPSAPPSPRTVSTGAPRIYDQNERNPLDPPLPQDRDLMIRTIHAEAGNQEPEGQRAVASVIRNRAANGGYGGDTVPGVIRAPNQFEPVNTPAGQQRMASLPVGSRQYEDIGKTVDQAYGGDDPTNGALNFFAPKAQAALGREPPAWGRGAGQDIGDHRFFGSPTAQAADPAALPPNATPTQGGPSAVAQAMTGAPAAPSPPTASLAAQNTPQGIPQQQKAAIARLMSATPGSPAYQLGLQIAGQALKPKDYGFQTLPDGTILRTDPHAGTVAPIYQAPSKPSWGIIGEDQFGNKKYGWIDPFKKTAEAGPDTSGTGGKPVTLTGPDGKTITVPEGQDPKKFREHVTTATADAAAGKNTEVQAKAAQFATRMELAEKNLVGLEDQAGGVSGAAQQIAGKTPVVGSAMQTKEYQKYEQSKSAFITALLRQESGAAINKSEFERYEKELFPQPGDAKEVMDQKRELRRAAIMTMRQNAGPGSKPAATIPEAAPVAMAAPKVGEEKEFKQGIGVWDGTKWVPKGGPGA